MPYAVDDYSVVGRGLTQNHAYFGGAYIQADYNV
jgi:hypothetical protein